MSHNLFTLPQSRTTDPSTSKACANTPLLAKTARHVLAEMREGEIYSDEALHVLIVARGSTVTADRCRHGRLVLQHEGLIEQAGYGLTSNGSKCRLWRLRK